MAGLPRICHSHPSDSQSIWSDMQCCVASIFKGTAAAPSRTQWRATAPLWLAPQTSPHPYFVHFNQKISFKLTHLSNEPTVGGNGNFRQALERCTYTLKQCFWAKLGPYSIVMCQLSCGKDSLYQQLLHRQPTQLIIFLTVSPLQFLTASTTNRSTTTSTTTSSPLPFIAYRYYMPAGWLLF